MVNCCNEKRAVRNWMFVYGLWKYYLLSFQIECKFISSHCSAVTVIPVWAVSQICCRCWSFFSSALPQVLIIEQIFSTGKKQAHPNRKHSHELTGWGENFSLFHLYMSVQEVLLHHLIAFAPVGAEESPGGQALGTCCLLICVYNSFKKGHSPKKDIGILKPWNTNRVQIYIRLQFHAGKQYLVICQSRKMGGGRYHKTNASTRLFLNISEIWALIKVCT